MIRARIKAFIVARLAANEARVAPRRFTVSGALWRVLRPWLRNA
jgi:hypothetical protein